MRSIDWQRRFIDRELLDATPWMPLEFEQTRALMGDDWLPYGVEPNRAMIQAFCDESHAQGLAARRLTADELFAEFLDLMQAPEHGA